MSSLNFLRALGGVFILISLAFSFVFKFENLVLSLLLINGIISVVFGVVKGELMIVLKDLSGLSNKEPPFFIRLAVVCAFTAVITYSLSEIVTGLLAQFVISLASYCVLLLLVSMGKSNSSGI